MCSSMNLPTVRRLHREDVFQMTDSDVFQQKPAVAGVRLDWKTGGPRKDFLEEDRGIAHISAGVDNIFNVIRREGRQSNYSAFKCRIIRHNAR